MGAEAVRRRLLVAVVAVLGAACAGGSSDDTIDLETTVPERSVLDRSEPLGSVASTTVGPEPADPPITMAPTTTVEPAIDVDALLAADSMIGLNVIPPRTDDALPVPRGMADFHEMFTPAGQERWAESLQRIDVFKLHALQVRHYLSDDQLRVVLEFLAEHDLPLMFETEPLPPPDPNECQHGESFEGPYDLEVARRIRDLGGTIHVVAIEQPYHFAHKLDTPGACQYPVERVVDEVIDYVVQMRQIFPDVPVGTIEGVWSSPATTPDDLATWLDTYEERAGEPFAFLHLDPDWSWERAPEVIAGIERVADARGVPFGMLYNGGSATDSVSWMQALVDHAALLEVDHGITPQHAFIQSWVDRPELALPEDDPASLTSGVLRYTADRTVLSAEAGADGSVTARLATSAGEPVAGVDVVLDRRLLDDAFGETVLRGRVPAEATDAEILLRVNFEGAGPGPADARVSTISYVDGGGSASVPNGDFDDGLAGWGISGEPLGEVRTGGSDGDRWVEIDATAEEQVVVNGPRIPVSAGTDFELRVTYGIAPPTAGSVIVAVEFLPGNERHVLTLDTPSAPRIVATTDADGVAVFPPGGTPPGPAELRLTYAGDLTSWPANTVITVGG